MFSQEETVFSVGEISARIKSLLEGNIGRVTVEGEISSFSESSARHWYFSLKDSRTPALLSAVCFSYRRPPLMKKPAVGDTIRAEGRLSAYDAKSSYQLIAESIRTAGRGDLFRRLEELSCTPKEYSTQPANARCRRFRGRSALSLRLKERCSAISAPGSGCTARRCG